MARWIFLASQPDRSASGDAFRNPFEGQKKTVSLSREAIQNSVDARGASRIVRICFVWKDNVDLSAILDSTFWRHVDGGGVPGNVSRTGSALYVEDYNTTGLTGSMLDMRSNMYKLMGGLGGSVKAGGEGGSFGYGKAASILNSGLWTVIAFTVTSEPDSSEARYALFATAYLNSHEIAGQDFTGIGWYCDDEAAETAPLETTGEEAVELARKMGIPRATTLERGTTLLIPHPSIGVDDLKQEVALNWWPRIDDHSLAVEYHIGGSRSTPNLNDYPVIQPYRRLFSIAQLKSEPDDEELFTEISYLGKKLGRLALGVDDDVIKHMDEETKVGRSIALMRDTLMVVQYYNWGNPKHGVMGVFVASKELNEDLRITEPLTHDAWSEHATRANDLQRKLAWEVKDRVRKAHNAFVKAYAPPPSEDDQTLADVRRFFGSMLGGKGRSGEGHKADPFEIRDQVVGASPHLDGLRASGSALIKYRGKARAKVRLGARVTVDESDDGTVGDPLECVFRVGDQTATGTEPWIHFDLSPNTVLEVSMSTITPYDGNWTVTPEFRAEVVSI